MASIDHRKLVTAYASASILWEKRLTTYPAPPGSKRAVNQAGKAIANGLESPTDLELVDQWRAAHGYVINTFQIFLKRRIAAKEGKIEFAQRLKRRKTVIEKLRRRRPDGSLLMADVTSMQDYAGCRLIFENIASLREFRDYLRTSGLKNVKHKLRHAEDKYDYIEHPKPSGYRGIHDVFTHFPRAHRGGKAISEPWHGLFVEVQYRTKVQHAWATALEISDIIDGEKTKFALSQSERVRFFAIASELLARKHEKITRQFVDLSTEELKSDFVDLDSRLQIFARLEALKKARGVRITKHNVLRLALDRNGKPKLQVLNFQSAAAAIAAATEAESQQGVINAVYVHADNPQQVRSAYRNYFNDPVDFVKLLQAALR